MYFVSMQLITPISFSLSLSLSLSTGAIALHVAYFGEGVGIIFTDETDCIGNESSILDCSHLGLGTSDCFHNEDVSVLCQGIQIHPDLQYTTIKDLSIELQL